MSDPSQAIVIGVAGLIGGAMAGPIAADLWRKIKGTEYATKKDCMVRHDREEKDCIACKASTKASICSIQHEAAKNRKLMILIAMQVGVEKDDLKDVL